MSHDTLARMAWHYTIEEYVRLEDSTHIKHEYINGEIRVMGGVIEEEVEVRAMGGGTIGHARMAIAIASMLTRQLEGRRCAVFSSDARVRVLASDVITYPDLVVCRGSVEQDPRDRLAIVNPIAVVEITSPSSDRYDRGWKLEQYKLVPSLCDIVIVSHRGRRIEVHHRDEDGWTIERAALGRRSASTRLVVPSTSMRSITTRSRSRSPHHATGRIAGAWRCTTRLRCRTAAASSTASCD